MAQTIKFTFKMNIEGKEKLVETSTNAEELQKALSEARSYAENLRHTLMTYNQAVDAMRNISEAIGQITDILNNATSEYRSFSNAMSEANTMAGKGGEDFSRMKDKVSDLAKEVPVARDELARGLYQVISNGVPEDNWISFLRDSAKASVGGLADLGETVKVTSTLIKNYGLDWSQAGDIQDKIQLTAKNGVTSFEQMAQALPRVSGNAATLGVSIDDLMASFATLTGVSGNTAEVSTQLAAIFTALVKPSSEAQKQAAAMGIEFDAAAIKGAGGFRKFLKQLDKSVQEYAQKSGELPQEIYGKLFGSAESLRAITPLVGELSSKFDENADTMKNSAGTIEDAFDTMSDTGTSKIQLLKNQISSLTDSASGIVTPFLPVLNVVSQLGMGVFGILSLSQAFSKLGIASKAAAVGHWALAQAQTAVATTSAAMPAALTGILSKIGGILGVLGPMAAALGAVAVIELEVKEYIEDTDDAIVKAKEDAANLKKTTDENKDALRKYLPIAQNTKASTEQRREAINKLKSLYPDFFKNLDTATAKQYDLADAINYANRQYRNQLAEMARLADAQYNEAKELYDKNHANDNNGGPSAIVPGAYRGTEVQMAAEEKANLDRLDKYRKELHKELDELDKELNKPVKKVQRPEPSKDNKNKQKDPSTMSYGEVKDEINRILPQLNGDANSALSKYYRRLVARKDAIEKANGIGTKSTPKKTSKEYQSEISKIDKQITELEDKFAHAGATERKTIRKSIQSLQDKKKALEMAKLEAERPVNIKTESDADKELSYLNALKENADKKAIPAIDALINEVNLFKASLHRPERLDTVENVENEIKYQQALLKTASKDNIQSINDEIEKLKILEQQLKNTYRPGSINYANAKLQQAQNEYNIADTDEERSRQRKIIKSLRDEVEALNAEYEKGSVADYTSQIQKLNTQLENVNLSERERIELIAKRRALQKQQTGIQAVEEAEGVDMSVDLDKDNTDYDALLKNLESRYSELYKKMRPKVNFAMPSIDMKTGEIMDAKLDFSVDGLDDLTALSALIEEIRKRKQKLDEAATKNALIDQYGGDLVQTQKNIMGLANDFKTCGATAETVGSAIAFAGQSLQQLGGDGAAAKAGAIAAALGQLALGYAYATSKAGKDLGPWAWVAFGLAGLSTLITMINTISGFATGGIVGGSSYSGDKVPVRVNSGEMILTARQQARLFAIANGALQPYITAPAYGQALMGGVTVNTGTVSGGGMIGGNVNFTIKGRNLVGTIANESRHGSRIGKRTMIKI